MGQAAGEYRETLCNRKRKTTLKTAFRREWSGKEKEENKGLQLSSVLSQKLHFKFHFPFPWIGSTFHLKLRSLHNQVVPWATVCCYFLFNNNIIRPCEQNNASLQMESCASTSTTYLTMSKASDILAIGSTTQFLRMQQMFWWPNALLNAVNPEYSVRTQFLYPGLSDLSHAWNFLTVADCCGFSDLPCTFRMHFIFVRKPSHTKYTKLTCIRNIVDLQYQFPYSMGFHVLVVAIGYRTQTRSLKLQINLWRLAASMFTSRASRTW